MSRTHVRVHGPGGARGMTLLEVLIAVSILAVIVVVLTGSLRVGLRAWEAGERRAAVQQEIRAVIELLTEALSAAYPYNGRLGGSLQRVVLFDGEPDAVRFVTSAPPLALDAPAPFHAVVLDHSEETSELRVVERLVPSDDPFGDGTPVILSRSVVEFKLEYRDEHGAWLTQWDGRTNTALPTAIRVDLTLRHRGRVEKVPTFDVPIVLRRVG